MNMALENGENSTRTHGEGWAGVMSNALTVKLV